MDIFQIKNCFGQRRRVEVMGPTIHSTLERFGSGIIALSSSYDGEFAEGRDGLSVSFHSTTL